SKPNQIDLSRDHLGLVSAEGDSGSDRDESIFYISDSKSFHFTLSHNRAHYVLEKNDLGNRRFGSLHPFDPEIENTLNRIRKSKNMHVWHSSDSFSSIPKIDNF
ncbi:hypothetical protein CR513_18725, partial [Mucuna pruriens]